VLQDVRKNYKNEFAVAIAEDESIIAWAQQNGVPQRTAFRWAIDPEVRRALGRAIGRLSSVAMKAADGITKLAQGAESESVQLRAWRAVRTDQIAVSTFSDLEYRMAEIEEQLNKRAEHTHPAR
jgi:hypothetical protein